MFTSLIEDTIPHREATKNNYHPAHYQARKNL